MLRVIFRTCEKVNSLHGLPRPFNLTKRQTIEACFKSLVKALDFSNKDYEIHIVADAVSDDLMNFFLANSRKIASTINKKLGNDESLRQSFQFLEDSHQFDDEDIVYFVEDDYLHFSHGFDSLIEFIEKTPLELFIHPTDYPDQYRRPDLIINAIILLGKYNHFRQVSSTTFTLMGKKKSFIKNYPFIISSCTGANDGMLSQMFTQIPCFSPIPGFATHMHEGVMSPYVAWDKIIEDFT